MFTVTDSELDSMEGVTPPARQERPRQAHQGLPIAGLAEDPGAPPPPLSPGTLPVAMPIGPSGEGGGAASGAGKALLLIAVGLVGGGLVGGAWGAAAGVAGMGALRNLSRTKDMFRHPDPAARSEAAKSATMGVFGLGIAGMLGFQAYKHKMGDGGESSS